MDDPQLLRVRTLATGGDAVAHPVTPASDGDGPATWFVADALPGELVRARPVRRARNHVVGELVEVVEPSADRVVPPCPLAGTCGGCGWQHVGAAVQLARKTEMVAAAMRGLGVSPVAMVDPKLGEGLGYRRRARLHYRREGDALALGFHRRRSHDVIDAPACPVLSPALRHAFARLRRAAAVLPAEGEVFATSDGRRVVLGLPGVRPSREGLAALEACLDRTLIGIEVRGGRKQAIVGDARIAIDGAGSLPALEISPFVFVQAQAEGNRALVRHVVGRARADGARVLELYAGAGNFTRALARVARRVWTCDDDREAVGALRRLAERENLPINAKHGDSAALVPKIAAGPTRYEVVIADPPRTGLGAPLARAIAQVATDRIVLVSCDAANAARDLGALVKAGWRIDEVAVFDLMPMTPEVEIVTTLRPGGPR